MINCFLKSFIIKVKRTVTWSEKQVGHEALKLTTSIKIEKRTQVLDDKPLKVGGSEKKTNDLKIKIN